MAGDCGSCTACCRVFAIPAPIKKPINEWCKFCEIGKGCKIYDNRPSVCREFTCLWLESQSRESKLEQLPPELRPDRCRVVISATTSPSVISFTTMPGNPTAWRKGEIYRLGCQIAKKGLHVVIGAPGSLRRTVLTRHPGTHEVIEKEQRMTEPDEDGMQWNIDE